MIIIKTSSNKLSILKNIAKYLIKNKLAGCVNLLPGGTSFFNWESKVNENKEHFILIKTIKANEKSIYQKIKKLHNYTIPEIITLKVNNIDKSYNKWLKKVTYND